MRRRTSTWIARFSLGVSGALLAISLPLLVLNVPRTGFGPVPFFIEMSAAVAYTALGTLIAVRQPRNAVGWMLLSVGAAASFDQFGREYVLYGLVTSPGSLPAVRVLAWLSPWVFQSMLLILPLFLLLFPDGQPPTAQWRPLVWLVAAGIAFSAFAALLSPREITAGNQGLYHQFKLMSNPVDIPAIANVLASLNTVLNVSIPPVLLAVLASLIRRFWRGPSEQREQVKWLAYAAGLICLILIGGQIVHRFVSSHWVGDITWALAALVVVLGFPAAATVAILKYHLYDIDVVINRSLVFGAMAAFIAAVYVGMVAGVGALIGSTSQPNLALSVLATAVVAIVFQPVRERVEQWANLLVYGRRATPYEILAQFSDRIGATYAGEEIMLRMARVLAEGTGAQRADVWLRTGDHVAPTASWPDTNRWIADSVRLNGQLLPSIPGVTRVVAVSHQGELLGALTVTKRPGEALTPIEERLLKDLAGQAGLVLRNVRLSGDLRRRLQQISQQAQELEASRQRIVAAQDAERRRLERNIHDGAQQHLVALTVKLRLAASQAKLDPRRALKTVEALAAETDDALQTLRDLARGIYPAVLRTDGLVAALQTHANRMDLPVEIKANDVGRYPEEVEAAMYFSVLEALQNASKHSDARSIRVLFEQRDGSLTVSVTDDGKGFDPAAVRRGSGLENMADRIAALGGRLTVSSSVGGGAVVKALLPVAVVEPVG
jgi:signal transduction histidine kinase